MILPPQLIAEMKQGNIVLMLGAGASLSATAKNGDRPPTSSELAKLLANHFLTPDYATRGLTNVAGFAIDESDLFTVQDFIREDLIRFSPSPSHRQLPTFSWRALITTNYDVLIETAYAEHPSPRQTLVPFYRNTDHWDTLMRDPSTLPLLKLHGCVNNTHEENCPLILSPDQYLDYRHGRDRLYRQFKELAAERSLLFVGYSLGDPHITALLRELDREKVGRPRSYLVTPEIDSIASRYWDKRHITALTGTFQELMETLNAELSGFLRDFRRATPVGTTAINERIAVAGFAFADSTFKSLELDLEYVKAIVADGVTDPRRFYAGVSQDWGPIQDDLDVRRNLTDTILSEYFLDDAPKSHRFVLIKAFAGNGKTVFLRRLAWEAARTYGRLCLYARADSDLNSAVILDIITGCKEHVYLFVDDALAYRRQLESLIRNLGTASAALTIVSGTRTNEWNVSPSTFRALVTNEHTLGYLSPSELDVLVTLLEKHGALDALAKLPRGKRRDELKELAGRQLLVALHEATSGDRFEKILHDEFVRIAPSKARAIYLMICMLNQFGVPVRAGLVSRRFGVTFDQFKEQFFAPLEDVVLVKMPRGREDVCYTARHRHVAEIVVRNELTHADDLYNEYIEIFNELNISYEADELAFSRMTQARLLADLFSDPLVVFRIFEKAVETAGEENPFLLQQMAVYEMNRANGNLTRAGQMLDRAVELRPRSRILRHSCAELYLRRSDAARTDLEKRRYLDRAVDLCRELKRDATDSYPFSTSVKAGLQRLRQICADEELLKTEDVEGLIQAVEKELKVGLQEFPNDAFLLEQEAKLAKMLAEDERLMTALQRSFAGNPRNANVAIQLARGLEQAGDVSGAFEVLVKAIEAKSGDTRLHYSLGLLMEQHGLGSPDELRYHYRSSFRPGDINRDAQMRYGRQLFIAGNFDGCREAFADLKAARLPGDVKRAHCYPLAETFRGVIQTIEAYYCIIRRDGDGVSVRLDLDDVGEHVEWRDLRRYQAVTFRIAFTMFGPEAFEVRNAEAS